MKFRKMNLEDLEAVMKIERELFSSPWGKEHFEYEITQNPFALNLVGEINGEIVCVGCLWTIFERAEITTFGVSKKYQRQGIGDALLKELVVKASRAGCSTLLLDVRISNTPAIQLYMKHGFTTFDVRKEYYSDNHEDAYQMRKELT